MRLREPHPERGRRRPGGFPSGLRAEGTSGHRGSTTAVPRRGRAGPADGRPTTAPGSPAADGSARAMVPAATPSQTSRRHDTSHDHTRGMGSWCRRGTHTWPPFGPCPPHPWVVSVTARRVHAPDRASAVWPRCHQFPGSGGWSKTRAPKQSTFALMCGCGSWSRSNVSNAGPSPWATWLSKALAECGTKMPA